MSFPHAVVWIDHHNAQVQDFNADEAHSVHLKEAVADTRAHKSGVRTEHEFFGHVCDALTSPAILVTGAHMAQADFRHYTDKHRPDVASRIAGWETVDHPTEGELLALGRKFFVAHNRMVGTSPMGDKPGA